MAIPLVASFLAAHTLSANKYLDQYGADPVLVSQGAQSLLLRSVDFTNQMVVAEVDGMGEVSMPINPIMAETMTLELGITPKTRNNFANGSFSEVLRILRPKVYPLIKFSGLPDTFEQLHAPIRMMMQALLGAGELEELNSILERIELDQSSVEYSRIAVGLMNAYIADGDIGNAARMAQSVPLGGIYKANVRPILDAADALRAAAKYESVIPIYRTLEDAVKPEARNNVRMWLAYCLVLANRLEEASPMIDELPEPPRNDRLFSLYKLLQGSRSYRRGEYPEALDSLTRGFVRAQTSYSWVPEMLFLIGDCYNRADDLRAARNVWIEISILYPESPWAARANASLDKMPELTEISEETN